MPEPERKPSEEGPAPAARTWPRRLLEWAILGVAIWQVALFFHIHQYVPNHYSRFVEGARDAPGLLATYRHIFDLGANPYHYYGDVDWIALAIAAGAAAALVVIGYLALLALDLFIPRLARIALAYVVGMGAVGVALEIEAIFGLYRRESIGATAGVLCLLFAVLVRHKRRQRVARGVVGDWGTQRDEIEKEYAQRYHDSLRPMDGPFARVVFMLLFGLIGLITLLTFFHGALCPVTYWDSLILYVGYARRMFDEGGFPFKAVAQVGIGLGANYPHLYPLITAATATVAGRWSDSFAQLGPPLAGLLSCILVYHTALRLTRDRLLSIALTAVFRAVPYGIAYSIYASDYAFVILFVAAFLYMAILYLETNLTGYFVVATLIPAFAMHINYLMGGLWIVWAAMLLLAHLRPYREPEEEPLEILDEMDIPCDPVELQTAHPQPPTLLKLLATPRVWAWVLVAGAVASPWYVRNWVLTGNPVYAFFPGLFPKTMNYNQEVMDSATVEWTLNGDGIGNAALARSPAFWEQFNRFRLAADVSNMEIARIETPLSRKLAASWRFWVTDYDPDARRFLRQTWKLAFLFVGIAVPGMLAFLLGCRRLRDHDPTDREAMARRRFGWTCIVLLVFLLSFHYLMAGFYLYQIIPIALLIPAFGAYSARALSSRFTRGLFVALAIWIAVFPGLPMALMGFKIKSGLWIAPSEDPLVPPAVIHDPDPQTGPGRYYSPFELVALHFVGVDRDTFQEMAFGQDALALRGLETYCIDETVLTHENRHLAFDRRVAIVHFDDPQIQALWRKSPAEQLRGLRELGITYYLFTLNEMNHQVNRRLGPPGPKDYARGEPEPWQLSALRGWIESGVLAHIETFGENRLYRFKYPGGDAAEAGSSP